MGDKKKSPDVEDTDHSWYFGVQGVDFEYVMVRSIGFHHDGSEYESQWYVKKKIEKVRENEA